MKLYEVLKEVLDKKLNEIIKMKLKNIILL